jgi:hypothetical protein
VQFEWSGVTLFSEKIVCFVELNVLFRLLVVRIQHGQQRTALMDSYQQNIKRLLACRVQFDLKQSAGRIEFPSTRYDTRLKMSRTCADGGCGRLSSCRLTP